MAARAFANSCLAPLLRELTKRCRSKSSARIRSSEPHPASPCGSIPPRPMCSAPPRSKRRSPASPSASTRRYYCCLLPPIVTRAGGSAPTNSTSPAASLVILGSAPASTAVSARWSRGSKGKRCLPRSPPAWRRSRCRRCGLSRQQRAARAQLTARAYRAEIATPFSPPQHPASASRPWHPARTPRPAPRHCEQVCHLVVAEMHPVRPLIHQYRDRRSLRLPGRAWRDDR